MLRPEPVRLVTGIAENVGGIYKSSGIRAVNKGMSMAGKSADLAKLQGCRPGTGASSWAC